METRMQGRTLAITALAVVGGLLLSNRMRRTRMTELVVPVRVSSPALPVEDSMTAMRMPSATTVTSVSAMLAGGLLVSMLARRMGESRSQSSIEESIELNVPVSTAYNQWTQFEEFPKFMDSVHEVRQLDDKRLHWKADVMGKTIEWDAEIYEQIPDQSIAWRSTSGKRNDGELTFDKLSENRTRITLKMAYTPEGPVEAIGGMMGAVSREASSNLRRFKEMIEQRGKETGAWRGAIKDQGQGMQPAT